MADGLKFKLEGFEELEKDLKRLGRDAEKVLRAGIRAGAVRVKKEAQQNLAGHRRTGELSASLRVSARLNRAKRSVTATVRNTRDTFYGLFLEFGTIRQSGIKWLTRALRDSAQDVFNKDVAGRMRKRIAKMRN